MLGEAGATVYCTGRGAAGTPSGGRHAGRPETVEETAEMVTRRRRHRHRRARGPRGGGGGGGAVRPRAAEQGRLDVQVNVLGSPNMQGFKPFWELDLAEDLAGIRVVRVAARHHLPPRRPADDGGKARADRDRPGEPHAGLRRLDVLRPGPRHAQAADVRPGGGAGAARRGGGGHRARLHADGGGAGHAGRDGGELARGGARRARRRRTSASRDRRRRASWAAPSPRWRRTRR